ncbi:M56 family metallopeptidase [Anaerolentibacter hominis]|uniref:M56 family metallopeptidase n=1 Tax=Anaerolentibacter hominis TaxID=3079009 RepID=UPI0031B8B186
MNELFIKFVNMSVSASWLILAVLVLRILLKKAPKWLNPLLWGIVGIRLILPFSIQSALSLIPSAETISPDIMYAQEPAVHTGIPALNRILNPAITNSFAPEAAASANPLQIWTALASALWILGIAVMLLYTGISYLRLVRRMKTAVLLRDNIYQSEYALSPFVLGILRPRIYMPFQMPQKDAAHVIAHEQAHIRRHDHWIKPLGFLLLSLHWFNPLLWAAYILFCRDIELACDERVIKDLGTQQRADYSQALLSLSVPGKIIAACPLAFGEVGVKKRVKNVLHYKKPSFWLIILAVAACITVTVCFLTNPKDKISNTPDPSGNMYQVEAILYADPVYSFAYTPETAPLYLLKDDFQLLVRENDGSDTWIQAGTFTEETLTASSFDRYFVNYGEYSGWSDDTLNPESIRKSCSKAWRLDTGDTDIPVFYLLLRLDNGALYLTYGYDDSSNPASEAGNSRVRWVFELAPATSDAAKEDLPQSSEVVPEESAETVIKSLLETICADPSPDSRPQSYVDAHPEEYQALIGNGADTLRYCFGLFDQGGQTGLESHIMARACEDILECKGKIPVDAENASTGQEWYDTLYAHGSNLVDPYLGEGVADSY